MKSTGNVYWRPIYFEVGHAYQLLLLINFSKHPTSPPDLSLKKFYLMAIVQHRGESGNG